MQGDTRFLEMTTLPQQQLIVQKNIYDNNRILKILQGRKKDAAGPSLAWRTVAHRNETITKFKGLSYVNSQSNNPLEGLALSPGQYAGSVTFAWDELKQNRGNKEKLVDMSQVQMENVQDTLLEETGIDAFTGDTVTNGFQGLIGLQAAISATNTYAGINRATAGNEFWKSNVYTNAPSPSDMENIVSTNYLPRLMAAGYSAADHGKAPNYILTTEDIYNSYMIIAQVNNLKFEGSVADLGFPTLKYQGATMFYDKHCPQYHMFMINTEDWNLYVYPDANFEFVKDEDTGSIWVRGQNQLGKTAYLAFMGQIQLQKPRQQTKFTLLGSGS